MHFRVPQPHFSDLKDNCTLMENIFIMFRIDARRLGAISEPCTWTIPMEDPAALFETACNGSWDPTQKPQASIKSTYHVVEDPGSTPGIYLALPGVSSNDAVEVVGA